MYRGHPNSSAIETTTSFLKLLGRLLIDNRSVEPDNKEFLTLSIPLTFIEEISSQIRQKLSQSNHVTLFTGIIQSLIDTQTADDQTVALLQLLSQKDFQDHIRIGGYVYDNSDPEMKIGEIINFLGDLATVFVHLDPNYQVKQVPISELENPSTPLRIHKGLFKALAGLVGMSCDFISNGNRIGRTPTGRVIKF